MVKIITNKLVLIRFLIALSFLVSMARKSLSRFGEAGAVDYGPLALRPVPAR
jgi:hypothetical protein